MFLWVLLQIIFFTLTFHYLKCYVRHYSFTKKAHLTELCKNKTTFDIASSIVSIIHSLLVCAYTYYIWDDFERSGNRMTHQNLPTLNHPGFESAISFTCAYIIYDFIWMCYYRTCTKIFIVHHLVTFIALSIGLFTPYGKYVLFLSLFNEASTPFYNFNILFSICAKYEIYEVDPRIKYWNQVIFALVFFLCRTCLLSWILYHMVYSYQTIPMVTILYVLYFGHYMINLNWLSWVIQKIL
jgi:hypothetical protein